MKFNDDITQSIASTVKNVLEGKATKEEVKYPHDMFHPETGKKEVAKTPEDHEKLAKQGYTHEKPKLDEVEQPKAKGEKDFKKMHDDNVEVSGESPDGKVTKAKKGNYYKEEVDEESEKQAKYKKFFDAALKKFGVDSPADLDDAKKKEFFNYIDKNYKAKEEESDLEETTTKNVDETLDRIREANVEKQKSMRSILADIWKMNEGKSPFEKYEGFASDAQRRAAFASGYKAKGKKGKKEEIEKSSKTATGQKPTKVEIEPEVK